MQTQILRYLTLIFIVTLVQIFQPGQGLLAKSRKTLNARKVYKQVHVLCIGINKFKVRLEGISDLSWAEADAVQLSRIFSDTYGYKTKLLLGADATKQNIQDELDSYKETLSDSDVLILTFSGHAHTVLNGISREGFLIPADARINQNNVSDIATWQQEALPMKYITDYVESLKAQHVLLFADVCYSGFLGKRGAEALSGRYDLQMLMKGKSRKVITAGKADQKALENAKLQHGVFSWSLLETLKKPGLKSTYDLFINIRELTSKKSRSKMLPLLRDITMENDGEFVFIPKSFDKVKEDEMKRAMVGRHTLLKNATTIEDLFSVIEEPDPEFTLRILDNDYKTFWKDKFQQYEQNATLGSSLAMTGLYYFYTKGLGTAKDLNKAKFWAMEAYETGHESGMHAMAEFLRSGVDEESSDIIADRLLNKAANLGFPPSRLQIAIFAIASDKSQYAKYEKWIKEAFDKGSKNAGVTFAVKGGLSRLRHKNDIHAAEKLLTKLAESGHARAMYLLAKLYWLNRDGFPKKSEPKAWLLLTQAAENGDYWAQLEVAIAYCQFPGWNRSTYGQRKSPQKCRQWAELAQKQDYNGANEVLYNYFYRGLAGAPDIKKAGHYLEAAVKENQAWALFQTGVHYKDGNIYPKDINKAKHYLIRAAEAGEAVANAALFDIFYQEINWKPFFQNKGFFSNGKDLSAFDQAFQSAGKALQNGLIQPFMIKRIKKNGTIFQQYLIRRAGETWKTHPEMLLVLAYCKEAFHPISSYRQTSRKKNRNSFFTSWNSFFAEYADRLDAQAKEEYSAILRKASK